jgi:hypothetical protein
LGIAIGLRPGRPTLLATGRPRIVDFYCSRESASATGSMQETDDGASALRV